MLLFTISCGKARSVVPGLAKAVIPTSTPGVGGFFFLGRKGEESWRGQILTTEGVVGGVISDLWPASDVRLECSSVPAAPLRHNGPAVAAAVLHLCVKAVGLVTCG